MPDKKSRGFPLAIIRMPRVVVLTDERSIVTVLYIVYGPDSPAYARYKA